MFGVGRRRSAKPATLKGHISVPSQTSPPRVVRGKNPRVSVIIPALNEAKNLPHVFAALPSDVFEVILVDGRSVDGTPEVARQLRPDIEIVRQPGGARETPSPADSRMPVATSL